MICSQTRLVGIGIDGQQMLFILFYFILFYFILFYFILLALPWRNTKKKHCRYANKILGQGHRNC